MRKNTLCFGDNLAFLKNPTLFPDESIDLIYLDPPFNTQRGYNVLFKEVDGTPSTLQIQVIYRYPELERRRRRAPR